MDRIDDAVSRILTAKFDLGLFEHPMTDRRNLDEIGSRAHHAVAREAAAKSQVLLRNEGDTVPLSTHEDVYVAGSNADNIGNQAGGWTLTWQGGSTNVIPGTTILDGIEDANHGDVTYSETATAPVPPDAAGVVVVGETPYAEGFGDVGGPQWGFDPGRRRRPAAAADDAAQRRGPAGGRDGVRAGGVLHGAGRLRSAAGDPARAAHPDRRAGRVLAAR